MPGWDVKIRPAQEEDKKKGGDSSTTWVIVVILGALLLWWLYAGGAFAAIQGCGLYQDGVRCNGSSQGGSPSSPSSGHHHPHR
jgi:hypothetical protein